MIWRVARGNETFKSRKSSVLVLLFKAKLNKEPETHSWRLVRSASFDNLLETIYS